MINMIFKKIYIKYKIKNRINLCNILKKINNIFKKILKFKFKMYAKVVLLRSTVGR